MSNKIETAAHRLSISFSEESEIPSRYKKDRGRSGAEVKIKGDTMIEKRFKENTNQWRILINNMLTNLESDLAWRFINLTPKIEEGVKNVVDVKDWCDFHDYLVRRRDLEDCGPDELGCLSMLLSAFQREVEKKLMK